MKDTTNTKKGDFWSSADNSVEALRERRYLWMARAFMVICVVAMITTVMMIIALNSLMPLVRVQPFYLYIQDKNEQVLHVRRPAPETLDLNLVAESLIRQYLLSRLSIPADNQNLEEVWGTDGEVSWKSASSVFRDFQPTAVELLKQAKKEGLTRDVRILSLSKFRSEQDGDVWRAEVELTDMKKGWTEPMVMKWVVNLKVIFQPDRQNLTWEQRLKNPLGFWVKNYGMQVIK